MSDDNTDTLLHRTPDGELKPVNVLYFKDKVEMARKLPRGLFIFTGGWKAIEKMVIAGDITLSDTWLFISLCIRMRKGNKLMMTQRALSGALLMNQGYLSKSLRRLRQVDLIRGIGWKCVINPRVALQGGSKHLTDAVWNYQEALNR